MGMNINNKNLQIDTIDWFLIEAIEKGIPYSTRPFLDIGREIGISETEVIERIQTLRKSGIIKRFGVVVRHHELGYRANAMVVWNVPDNYVSEFAGHLTKSDVVTLCYRRPRNPPVWPYNLFCMIHGKDRETVIDHVEMLAGQYPYGKPDYNILFSKRRFKQRGMQYGKSYRNNIIEPAGITAHG